MDLQLDWDVSRLQGDFGNGPDTAYLLARLAAVPLQVMGPPGPQRILEVAAAEAVHACRLRLRGADVTVVEPSLVMLARARQRMAELGADLTLVRGVGEALPFGDRVFDRVLLDSAIDHVTYPDLVIREMTRVTKPDGRVVISFVNYESASMRVSRPLYRVGRRLGWLPLDATLFWDSPVPLEHTFECTYSLILALCAPHLELDAAFGVSMGWMVPGWAAFLRRLPRERALRLMQRLDRFAQRRPRHADVVFTVWRPRPQRAAVPVRRLAAAPDDPFYRSKAASEADFWAQSPFQAGLFGRGQPFSGDAWERGANEVYTGDPRRSWIEDLIARGPFTTAAALGCDDAGYERAWLERNGSARLDVYELSAGVIRTVHRRLPRGRFGVGGARRRARFVQADLNFVRLPREHYDVVWSSGCLHHVINLEHLLDEIARALRPGGLFALHDYVGERRRQFAAPRVARMNALLEEIPARYRSGPSAVPMQIGGLSPFCAIRSDEILGLIAARFDVVHRRLDGALFPAMYLLDLAAIEREAPELLARVRQAERDAAADPDLRPCSVYGVFRKRTAAPAAPRDPSRR